MDRARIIDYKGKEIILADYSGLSATHHYDKLMKVINEAKALSVKDDTRKLFLSDVSGSSANKEIISELKKFFLKAINRFSGSNIIAFDTREEAMERLVN